MSKKNQDCDSLLTRELIGLAKRGDLIAEQLLFQSFSELLLEETRRHSIMRKIRLNAAPEDVVNEVWTRFLVSDGINRFEDKGRGSFKKYLYTILNHTMKDHLRRQQTLKRGFKSDQNSDVRKKDLSYSKRESLESEASSEPTPTSNARESELMGFCKAVLKQKEYRIWKMAVCDELESSEISAQMGIPASTVRNILPKTKAKLINALENKLN